MENYCRICFKKIDDYSIYNLIKKNNVLCENCFNKFQAKFIKFKIGSIKGMAIYEYTDLIKNLIYKFKGCYDYELKDVFLYRYLTYLRIRYYGYYIVFVPSYFLDDARRGFNHVKAIFEGLKLKELPILKKVKEHKQSDQTYTGRRDINGVFSIDKNVCLKGKRILIVDDIITTGNTLLTSIELVRSQGAKKIEVLVVAKTKNKKKEEY